MRAIPSPLAPLAAISLATGLPALAAPDSVVVLAALALDVGAPPLPYGYQGPDLEPNLDEAAAAGVRVEVRGRAD